MKSNRYLGVVAFIISINAVWATPLEQLDTIEVQAESANQELENSGLKVDVLETEEYLNSSRDISQLLNTSAGIHIRQAGGLGSASELSLNGFSGNRVRYFIDGVPMENFGSALDLENFPLNLAQQIEVYKGVVPIALSADALGGAINISTPSLDSDFIDVSYSVGSFNTHRAALYAQTSTEEGYFFRVSSFLNATDNSYETVDVPIRDEFGNNIGTGTAERFHDAYESRMLNLKTGVAFVDYADELSFSMTVADNQNEMQHAEKSINRVFGKLETTNDTWLMSGIYKKEWTDWLINGHLLVGETEDTFDDTSARRYDWFGNYTLLEEGQGEFGTASLFTRTDDLLQGNLFTRYTINPQHDMSASVSFNKIERNGKDVVNEVNTSFVQPSWLEKSVLAAAYNFTSRNDHFNSSIFTKLYRYRAETIYEEYMPGGNALVKTSADDKNTGYGFSINYELTPTLTLKTSYEKAFRLPEADELLGDGDKYVRANPELKVEQSDNINIGLSHTANLSQLRISSEVNLFHRDAQDFIKFRLDRVINGIYENVADVRVQGIEIASRLEFAEQYSLEFNLTNQEMLDQSKITPDGLVNSSYDKELTNEPSLFANVRAGYHLDMNATQRLALYWNVHYVNEFFLYEESLGDEDQKNTVPEQTSHDIEVEYSFSRNTYHIGLMATNITDEVLYDNFHIQKPRRALYLKFRFTH